MTISPHRIQRHRTQVNRPIEKAVYAGRPSKLCNPFVVGNPMGLWLQAIYPSGLKVTFTIKEDRRLPPLTHNGAVVAFEDWLGHGQTPFVEHICNALSPHEETLTSMFNQKRYNILESIKSIEGQNLSCWCKLTQHCHADILLKLANQP